jgi:protein involved in polysaccharide export with SLBB domain
VVTPKGEQPAFTANFTDESEIRGDAGDALKAAVAKTNAQAAREDVRYEIQFFQNTVPSAFFERQGFVGADYPLKVGDQMVLSLWGAVESQTQLRVNNRGGVFVTGVGPVSVANLSLGEAEKVIRKKMEKVYSGLKNGRIQMSLRPSEVLPSKVFVFGDVRRPGGYDLPGDANVFLALYRAGGPNGLGSVRNIVVRRASGDSLVIDLYELIFEGKKPQAGVLRDGDVVFVPRAERIVQVKGDVPRVGRFELKAGENLDAALAFAGGPNPTASHNIVVSRLQADGRREVFDLGPVQDYASGKKDTTAFNGDQFLVMASTKTSTDYIEVTGAVWYPGTYPFEKGMGVKGAVELAGGMNDDGYKDRIVVQRYFPDSTFQFLSDDAAESHGLKLQEHDRVIVLSTRVLRNLQSISVEGAVKSPQVFEFHPGTNLKELIALAGGFTVRRLPGVVRVERLRRDGEQGVEELNFTINDDLSIENREELLLQPGDRVVVPFDPNYYEQELVTITGAVQNPGVYSLAAPNETFQAFMERVVLFAPGYYLGGGQLFRRTTRTTVTTTTTMGTGVYQITAPLDAALKGQVDPPIMLQAGDSIYIPYANPTVTVAGEVVSPGTVLWKKGWDISDYVNAAGGLAITGDEDRVVVTYADGSKSTEERAERNPDPGARIFVAYKEPPEPVKWTDVVSGVSAIAGVITTLITLVLVIQNGSN